MNIILLSGGSGKRLWPLSNDVRSKQFIKIFRNESGEYDSMVQRVYRQIKSVDPNAVVTIATSSTQVPAIHHQLGDSIGISVEPCRRDTFPAIALATAYLHEEMKVPSDEAVVVCPVDPYVDEDYFRALKRLSELAASGDANLTLMGIEPTEPSDKYGYIIPETKDEISFVRTFKEKPDTETAGKYIAEGALWNGGVFAYRIGYVLEKSRELLDYTDYLDLYNRYDSLKKISFDYAVVEHEKKIDVMRFAGRWVDIGTWNSFTEAMTESVIGDAVLNESCDNVHVLNELDVPVLCMGLKDVIVSASSQGILVSSRDASAGIKPYVEKMDQQIMFAEKSWGVFHVLDVEENSITIKVTISAGDHMNYHSHERRDEIWTIVSGEGRTLVDGMEQRVSSGDVITMQAGCKHTIFADTDMVLIEVQIGKNISNADKIKYEMPY